MARKKSFELDDLLQKDFALADSVRAKDETPEVGKPKRKKKEPFKKTLERILSMRVSEETVHQAVFLSTLGKDISYQEAIVLSLIIQAANGDMQAAAFIRDSLGGKQSEAQKERIIKFEDL